MNHANLILVVLLSLVGCQGEPPEGAQPAVQEPVAPEPPPPPKPVQEIPTKSPSEIGQEMYELGRESVAVEEDRQEAEEKLLNMQRVFYTVACVERITGSQKAAHKELDKLEKGRKSKAFEKCKKEILAMTPEEIAKATTDADGQPNAKLFNRP